jgi:lysophospholipase L1-like esterase
MKLGEAWAGRAKPGDANAKSAAITDGTDREIRARRRLRKQLTRTSPVYWVINSLPWHDGA